MRITPRQRHQLAEHEVGCGGRVVVSQHPSQIRNNQLEDLFDSIVANRVGIDHLHQRRCPLHERARQHLLRHFSVFDFQPFVERDLQLVDDVIEFGDPLGRDPHPHRFVEIGLAVAFRASQWDSGSQNHAGKKKNHQSRETRSPIHHRPNL